MDSKTEKVLAQIKSEFPEVRVVNKADSSLCRAIDFVIKLLTMGNAQDFMLLYYTTIGRTIYLPECYDSSPDATKAACLRHERVHLRQWREFGYFGMAVTYLFLVFPIGFAVGRAFLEQEAYEESLRAMVEYHGIEYVKDERVRASIVEQFTGPAYLWMWPFRGVIEEWYDRNVRRLEETSLYRQS